MGGSTISTDSSAVLARGQQFSQLSAQLQQLRNWELQGLVQQQAAYQPLINQSVVLEPRGFAQTVMSAQVEDVQPQFTPQESQLAVPPQQSIAQLQQPINIPQPIDHQCVVAQPQLATDQQVQLAIGREDVELEEIPADDNDKVKIDSILCPCIGNESEKYGFEISRANKTQSAIKMEISVQPVPGNVVEVNGQKDTHLALTYQEGKESVAVDWKMAKAGQKMISQIIYSLP